ncbi:MAG: EthD domain-containing protein, partial [Gammaproteobacteria bacterium]|nr:EthD domain-containing protein [Gammaproteobacteria bacterium]
MIAIGETACAVQRSGCSVDGFFHHAHSRRRHLQGGLCHFHTFDDPVNDQLAEARGGMESPYDGVAELWWTNPEAFAATAGETGQAAAMELLAGERKFIDLANSPLWFAYEYPQFNPSEDIVAREHGPLVKLFFCFRH